MAGGDTLAVTARPELPAPFGQHGQVQGLATLQGASRTLDRSPFLPF